MTLPKRLILLTNDDGICSEGLRANEEALADLGEIWVVAPDRERNANSHTITLNAPVTVLPEGERRFSTSGSPSDCVNIAIHRLLPRKPDLVVSGINKGANLAEDVTYSGTVGAATEATLLRIPSMAVSVAASGGFLFLPAAQAAREIAGWILQHGLPPGTLLNVNVPNVLDGSPLQVRWTRLGRKLYADFLEERSDAQGNRCFTYGRDTLQYLDAGDASETDWKAVKDGHVSVTPLRIDLTDHDFLESTMRMGPKRAAIGQTRADAAPEKDG
ncbi:MAG: 5'/3'-nucleotidase SurE [bacterium]